MAARRPNRRKRWSDIERSVRRGGASLIAGVDEVGRGPLAGPVVACAVIMPPDARAIAGVDDSKVLTHAGREKLAGKILERAHAVSLGAASSREIDRLNIFQATIVAIRRAITRLSIPPDHILVDGIHLRALGIEHTAVVGGDGRCFSIACASIIAKVTRDRLMCSLAQRYPLYGWERNAGYATRLHLEGVWAHGLTPHHRRSFNTDKQLELSFDDGDEILDDAPLTEITTDDGLVRPNDKLLGDMPAVRAIADLTAAAEMMASQERQLGSS